MSRFLNQNLRGRSFVGQDLREMSFERADIRGANFSKAMLQGANFSHAKAGLNGIAIILLLSISCLLTIASGLASGFISYLLVYFSQPQFIITTGFPPAIALYIFVSIFIWLLLKFDIITALKGFGITFIITCILSLAGALVAAVGIIGFIIGALAVAQTIYVAGKKGGWFIGALNLLISTIFATIGSREMTRIVAETSNTISLGTELTAIVFAVALPALSIYVGKKVLLDERFSLLQKIIIAFSAIGRGTNFKGADLSDANFTGAFLASADFTDATIRRTCWRHVHQLEFALITDTILTQPAVRDLLVTGNGKGEFFVRQNFKGANLAGADLQNANFTECDFSYATLRGACLEQANLAKAKVSGCDFYQAILTGACLESLQYSATTQFDNVICDYVYLSVGQNERRPKTGNFNIEEFQKLFAQ